jgi:small conductance mechanosensitive channel
MEVWQQFLDEVKLKLQDTQMWHDAAILVGRIVLILVASRIVLMLARRIIDRMTAERNRLKLRSRRVQTVGKLIKNTVGYAIHFIAILLILGEFNINLAPLLAGAGIVGLAIGFGAQSLVKDIISGFFIILEDHFSVGDVIETGKYKGTVEMIGLRTTRIKSWTGEVYIVPNGSINDVTNHSLNNSLAVIDVPVASTDSIESVTKMIESVLNKYEDSNLVKPPELLGVHSIGAENVIYRIVAECRPNTQSSVARKINAAIKLAFETDRNPRFYRIEEQHMAGG